jgi:hypothetical protein
MIRARVVSLALVAISVVVAVLTVTTPASAVGVFAWYKVGGNGPNSPCLGISGSSDQGGAPAVIGTCNSGSSTQQWRDTGRVIFSDGLPFFQFENGQHRCLGTVGGVVTPGTQVIQGACGGTGEGNFSQFWTHIQSNGGISWLNLSSSGTSSMCIGTQGSGTGSGTRVVIGGCSFSPTQTWFPRSSV